MRYMSQAKTTFFLGVEGGRGFAEKDTKMPCSTKGLS
jgi:hypothetical protein